MRLSIRDRLANAGRALFAAGEAETGSTSHAPEAYAQAYGFEEYATADVDEVLRKHGRGIYRTMLRRNSTVFAATQLLRLARLSTDINITPASSDEIDKTVARALIRNFDQLEEGSLKSVAYDWTEAVYMGWSCLEPRYREVSTFEGRPIQFHRVIKNVPTETLALKRDRGEVVDRGVWQIKPNLGRNAIPEGQHESMFDKWERSRFAFWAWFPDGDNPYGLSLCRPAYAPYKGVEFLMGRWTQHLERHGEPRFLGTVDDAKIKTQVLNQLKSFRSNLAAVITSGVKLDTIDVSRSAPANYKDAFLTFDRLIGRAILSPALLMENEGSTGSNALGMSHRASFADWIVGHIGEQGCDRLKDQLARPWAELNFGEVDCPDMRFAPLSQPDRVTLLTIAKLMSAGGMAPSKAQMFSALSWQEPDADAELFGDTGGDIEDEGGEDAGDTGGPFDKATPEDIIGGLEKAGEPVDEQTRALIEDLHAVSSRNGTADDMAEVYTGNGKRSRSYARDGWDARA